MRTTIRLDDELFRRAKETAARSGRTLAAVIEDALRQALNRLPENGGSKPYRIRSSGRGGPKPGVDLDDSAKDEK